MADIVLRVLALTDSFAQVWPELAGWAGAELHLEPWPARFRGGEACATILAAGGAEDMILDAVVEAIGHGATELVVVGAEHHHRPAVAALQAGAVNYFALPDELEALRGWVLERAQRALDRERASVLAARERSRYDFSRLIGESEELRAAISRVARIIPRGRATVLITGETGTGKELLAQAIHYNGPRARQPFVDINCSALPPTLLESELFGYERGAFTDARTPKPGLFEAADGGTLLLDEIGDLPLELQAKILRVLEEHTVRRLGSVHPRAVDVRIIAATHVDLAAAIRNRTFREDLYFRLAVIPVHLPPLRQRGNDVIILAEHFLRHFSADYDVPCPKLTPELRSVLTAHTWPGNIRELRNAIERAVLLGGGTLSRADLFLDPAAANPSAPADSEIPFPDTLDHIEAAAARAMLQRMDGNKRAAANALGISRSRLYRLLAAQGRL